LVDFYFLENFERNFFEKLFLVKFQEQRLLSGIVLKRMNSRRSY